MSSNRGAENNDQDVASVDMKSPNMLHNNQAMDMMSNHSQALPGQLNSSMLFGNANTITSQGVYFMCTGENSCSQIVCDLCQQIRVKEFETRPQL